MPVIFAGIGAVLLVCVVSMVMLLRHAPSGYEDADGFHHGKPDEVDAKDEIPAAEPSNDDDVRYG